MPVLPVVVYIEDKDTRFTGGNPSREALIYHLKTVHECEVYDYGNEYLFLEDLIRIRHAVESGRLLTVIVEEHEFNEEQHLTVIAKMRELSAMVPIVVLPHRVFEGAKGIEGYKRIYQYHNTSRRLSALIRRWRKNIRLPLDHFGTENTSDVSRVMKQLQHAYEVKYLQGEELGTPDHNGQVVAQALRIRLCPAEFLRQEFDETLQRSTAVLSDPGKEAYEIQLQKVRDYCSDRQDDFWFLLKDSQGDTSYGTQGDMVEGFAIDPITLEYCRTAGFGCHKSARMKLEHRLSWIADLEGKKRRSRKKEDELEHRVISGLFYLSVEGFTVPIVRFDAWTMKGENGIRIAQFLKQQRLAIPISIDDQKDFELMLVEC